MWKVIIVGCNGIVRKWTDAIRDRSDVEVTALVDVEPNRAEQLRLECGYKNARVFSNVDAALAETDGNLLFDLTPPFAHREITGKALRSGRHVFGEKPLSDSMETAREMVRTQEESGKRYFLMQNRRFLYGIQTMRRWMEGTELGTPFLLNCDMRLGAHFTGFRNEMDHPLLIDMLIHTFDEARYLLGDRKAVTGYCQEFSPPNDWYRGDSIAHCIFEMEGGILLNIRASWATRAENTSAHGEWKAHLTAGAVCWDGRDRVWINRALPVPADQFYYEEEGVREQVPLFTEGREEHNGCIDAMFQALNEDRPMMTECHNNLESLRMMYACLESTKTGGKVLVENI